MHWRSQGEWDRSRFSTPSALQVHQRKLFKNWEKHSVLCVFCVQKPWPIPGSRAGRWRGRRRRAGWRSPSFLVAAAALPAKKLKNWLLIVESWKLIVLTGTQCHGSEAWRFFFLARAWDFFCIFCYRGLSCWTSVTVSYGNWCFQLCRAIAYSDPVRISFHYTETLDLKYIATQKNSTPYFRSS